MERRNNPDQNQRDSPSSRRRKSAKKSPERKSLKELVRTPPSSGSARRRRSRRESSKAKRRDSDSRDSREKATSPPRESEGRDSREKPHSPRRESDDRGSREKPSPPRHDSGPHSPGREKNRMDEPFSPSTKPVQVQHIPALASSSSARPSSATHTPVAGSLAHSPVDDTAVVEVEEAQEQPDRREMDRISSKEMERRPSAESEKKPEHSPRHSPRKSPKHSPRSRDEAKVRQRRSRSRRDYEPQLKTAESPHSGILSPRAERRDRDRSRKSSKEQLQKEQRREDSKESDRRDSREIIRRLSFEPDRKELAERLRKLSKESSRRPSQESARKDSMEKVGITPIESPHGSRREHWKAFGQGDMFLKEAATPPSEPSDTTGKVKEKGTTTAPSMGREGHEPLPTEETLPPTSREEEPDRGQWSGKFDFLMSMIAYAVGLGNVWRFPYLCFKNGGGSFLVVYAIFFCLAAVPIFIMEVTIGQYLQRGAMEMWRMCPIFKGVGIGNVVIAFMCIAYFCVIVSWAIFYMISSFNSVLPWETCDNHWNDHTCVTGKESPAVLAKLARNLSNMGLMTQTSVEQFWENRVLQQTSSIEQFGGIQWELFLIMLLAWIIVYFALWKGITQARKFVYFCAMFPYFLLVVLLIRGLTLEGAGRGIYYYLKPNMTRLLDTTVWKDAGTQVFYSYGVGFGALIALGSHNKFNHNCFRDGFIMCVINGSTSILAGFAVFSILGYMSVVAQKDIADIVKPGVGLAFLAYPEVASNLPAKQLWSCLFFLMITILGLDSQVCMMEGLFTALEDTFPFILRKHKKVSLAVTCLIFFIIGIPMVTNAGAYWLQLLDTYGASGYALLFVVFFEVVGLSWGFGAERIRAALKEMVGITVSYPWVLIWKYAAPATCAVLFFFCLIYYRPIKYPTGEDYPVWANVFGFFLSSCSMVVIPGYAVYYMLFTNRHLSMKAKFLKGIKAPDIIETGLFRSTGIRSV
ncbi:hypothetical protein V3C99_010590 [Haemonchus contortus]